MDKKCNKCGLAKPSEEFYKRKSGERMGQVYEKCIVCMKSRGIEYYHLNHERQLKLAMLRKHRAYKIKRDFINKVKDRPCQDCGETYPSFVMDFDHTGMEIKLNHVATIVARNWSMEKIKAEVSKCDVVCSNCHRMRTHTKHAMVAKLVTAGL